MAIISKYDRGHAIMYVIKDKGTILVDTGAYFTKDDYIKVFRDEEIDPEKISLIVITHGHWDHFAGLSILRTLTPAPVICHRNAAEALLRGDDFNYPLWGDEGKKWSETFQPWTWQNPKGETADIIMDDKDFELTSYGVDGKLIYTPGHSDSSLSLILDSGEAFMGDFVMPSPFSGELVLSLICADRIAMIESLRRLLNHAEAFYDGHGGPYSKAELEKLLLEH